MILDATSAWIKGHDSAFSGAVDGINSLRYPGWISGSTGRVGRVELYLMTGHLFQRMDQRTWLRERKVTDCLQQQRGLPF
jgi:hypothetical protein